MTSNLNFVFTGYKYQTLMMKNEEYIVLREIALGDHDAFRTIFMQYFPKVKYFIAHLIKSETVAEELSQDIFLKIWISREQLPELHSFNAYVYKMARNAALNYINHQYVEEAYIASLNPGESATPIDEIEARELELLIQLTIGQMPEQRRKVYTMSRIDNLKNEEIATRLNLSKKTVENHLNLALKDIRNILTATLLLFL